MESIKLLLDYPIVVICLFLTVNILGCMSLYVLLRVIDMFKNHELELGGLNIKLKPPSHLHP